LGESEFYGSFPEHLFHIFGILFEPPVDRSGYGFLDLLNDFNGHFFLVSGRIYEYILYMKTRKHTFTAFLAIFGIITACIGCDDGNTGYVEKVCGYITDADHPDLAVPIYQKSATNAVTVKNNIIAGYDKLTGSDRSALATANNFNEVWVVDGRGYSFNPETGILSIGAYWAVNNDTDNIRDIFLYFVIPILTYDP
jgi:hypothetical protein